MLFISPLRLCFGNEQRAGSFSTEWHLHHGGKQLGNICGKVGFSSFSFLSSSPPPTTPFSPLFPFAVIRSIIIIIANVINMAAKSSHHVERLTNECLLWFSYLESVSLPSPDCLFFPLSLSLCLLVRPPHSSPCNLGNERSTIRAGTTQSAYRSPGGNPFFLRHSNLLRLN